MTLFAHQVEGVRRIVGQPYLWLGDEMGAGKTRQAIEAAQVLFERDEIDSVLLLAPAQVYRDVWSDSGLGQIAEYARVPTSVEEYRPRGRRWSSACAADNIQSRTLPWLVSNYEFIRSPARLRPFLPLATKRTLLVLDESLAIQSPTAETTRAVAAIRQRCGRVLLLNGTEGGGDTPAALYSQAKMMSPDILGCQHWYEYRAKYAQMGGYARLQRVRTPEGWKTKRVPVQIVGWTNLDDLWGRLAPYYLRRTKAECLDLPAKLPPVALDVPLSAASWAAYHEMRREAVVYLEGGAATASQAGVRGLRLAQICSGFLGGVRALDDEGRPYGAPDTREVGREKLEALLAWYQERLAENPASKLVVWCRFRAEAERAAAAFQERFGPGFRCGLIIGDQARDERQEAISLLDPRSAPEGPAVVVGTVRAGQYGLNLAAAWLVVHLSNDYSHVARSQSDDRVHRPGQTRPVSYFDFIATGPEGQRTVDYHVVKALRKKEDLARWGAAEWARALREE